MLAEQLRNRAAPGLLVSVRNADEARAALAGGADVIDVKEPNRGSLGAADWETIADVVRVVDARVPVTAAAGELLELLPAIAGHALRPIPEDVSLVKIGLAGCRTRSDWKSQWRRAIAALCHGGQTHKSHPVAVIYADWQTAGSPTPDEICSAAVDIGCRVLLIDTWEKSSGNLLDHWPPQELRLFVKHMRARGFAVALAGSLSGENLLAAAELRPHLVAVRGAACDGGRESSVTRNRVAELRHAMAAGTARRRATQLE